MVSQTVPVTWVPVPKTTRGKVARRMETSVVNCILFEGVLLNECVGFFQLLLEM